MLLGIIIIEKARANARNCQICWAQNRCRCVLKRFEQVQTTLDETLAMLKFPWIQSVRVRESSIKVFAGRFLASSEIFSCMLYF